MCALACDRHKSVCGGVFDVEGADGGGGGVEVKMGMEVLVRRLEVGEGI